MYLCCRVLVWNRSQWQKEVVPGLSIHVTCEDDRLLQGALMMEAARTSETLVNFSHTTRCYNPEDSHLHTHRRENLKSYFDITCCFLVAECARDSSCKNERSTQLQNLVLYVHKCMRLWCYGRVGFVEDWSWDTRVVKCLLQGTSENRVTSASTVATFRAVAQWNSGLSALLQRRSVFFFSSWTLLFSDSTTMFVRPHNFTGFVTRFVTFRPALPVHRTSRSGTRSFLTFHLHQYQQCIHGKSSTLVDCVHSLPVYLA
jgi:hypothetical protein